MPLPWITRKAALIALVLLGAGVGGAALLMRRGANPEYVPGMAVATTAGGDRLWVQTREVTIAEWNRCHEEGGCTLKLRPPVFADGTEEWPATGLSYIDVSEYLAWINDRARHKFRLPSSDEWAYLAAPVMPAKANPIFTDPELSWASSYLTENLVDRRLRPSQSWKETSEGIWDLNGNVWEWTQDCYNGVNGSAADASACPAFVVEGEHEAVIPYLVRDPARGGCAVGAPPPHLGMRLVSDRPV